MSLGKRLINTGAAAAACSTDSVQAFGADAAFSSNIALYQLDGNANDTTTNYDATSDTGVTYSATGAKFGQAASFNGSSKIDLPSTVVDSIKSNSSFAVSAWFNTSVTGTRQVMFSSFDGTYITLEVTTGNQLHGIVANSVGTQINLTIPITVTDGAWHHALFTGENGDLRLYLDNGTPQTSASWNGTFFNGTTGTDIGSRFGNYYFNGKIDQVRIFDKAISAEDVATLYAETTSTASNTNPFSEGAGVALYTMDYDSSEASGYYDGTPTNVEFGVGGKINYGARFNGSSSKIVATNPVSQEPFSVSMWVNYTETRLYKAFIGIGNNTTNAKFIINTQASGGLAAAFQHNGSYIFNFNHSTTGLNDGEWHHLAFSWDGTTNTNAVKFYIDKTLTSSTSTVAASSTNAFTELVIGTSTSSSASMIDGDIDQVRIFSKALSTDEVDELFVEAPCVYTCTTDDVNYPSGTTPVAYYKLDNSSEDYSTGGNDGSDTNIEYRFGRFGQAAVFNGSSSVITLGATHIPSSSDFSFSCWVNKISSAYGTILGQATSGASGRFSFNYDASNQFTIGIETATVITTSAFDTNQWHHLVFIRDGNDYTIYVDGSSAGTGTNSAALQQRTTDLGGLTGFGGVANSFDGSIDQVRIYSTALTSSQVTELYEEKPCADTSNFKTVLYNGTSAEQYISNVGMDLETNGGLVWMKSRDNTYNHTLYDSVRGTGTSKAIYSNEAVAENTYPTINNFVSFDANGFTVGATSHANNIINKTGDNLVAWVWKSGGEAVNIGVNSITGSTPSIASDVSANTAAGFSIVKYTGNTGADQTVATGLTTPCDIVIVKRLTDSGYSWCVGGSVVGNGNNLYLDSSGELLVRDRIKSVQSETFTVEQVHEVNNTGKDYIAYCFHSVLGYSKMGSYPGTGANGNAIYLDSNGDGTGTGGFQPSFILIKRTDYTDNWNIVDNQRGNNGLFPDLSSQELSNSGAVVFNTNGFTINGSAGGYNNSSGTYLYMAFK
jgi:hypothetical protein